MSASSTSSLEAERDATEVAETLITVANSNCTPTLHQQFSSTAFGFGIDSNPSEAAVKAVRDALDRTTPHKSEQYRISILLGVPLEQKSQVDIATLCTIIPQEFSTQTTIQTGGLYVPQSTKTIVVASLSFEMLQATAALQQPDMVELAASAGLSSSFSQATLTMEPPITSSQTFQPLVTQERPIPRENSIDMLAHVSVELMMGRQQQLDEDSEDARPSSSYKKLPPGKTPKNHERLFVKHEYRDFSHEVPMVGELSLVGPNALERTPNAPFPLKLHEILAQIEKNGHDHIMGWLPHGRSFKIHDHQEFVDIILPNYFVMNKKSSFLRQLNLYGFHRLSRVGSDQGSYYHEKFLKGMKFLCRRMSRQKVNGNGIRAAGNPDQEPNLAQFPICPPPVFEHQSQSTSPQQYSLDEYNSEASSNEYEGTPSEASCDGGTTLNVAGNTIDTSALDNIPPLLGTMQTASFPLKLQRILDKLECEQKTGTIKWLEHGRAFIVCDVARFVEELAPVYFNLTKYSSFQRQCHMYHFQRITCGRDKGAYYHSSFLRGRPDLAMLIQRTRINGKKVRRPGNPDKEPDFYFMPYRPPVTKSNFLGSHSVVSINDGEDSPGEDVVVGGEVSV